MKKKAVIYAAVYATVMLITYFLPNSVFSGENNLSAESYVLIEADTKAILSEKSSNAKMAPASTTKILTALIAIENTSPEQLVNISASAAAVSGSQIGLKAGEEVTMKDLLYMLLLKSANDAAEAIAESVAGSCEKFAALMNKRAKAIGCKSSNFVNPHGLPSDNHYTTAYDLALITAEALKNEFFASIVASKSYKTDYYSLVITNSNKLLFSADYIKGVKTGFTKAAGRCLVSAAEKDGVTLIAVTLRAPDDWNDHIKLYESAYGRVSRKLLYEPYTYKCVRNALNGDNKVIICNTSSIYGLVIDGKAVYYEYREDIEPIMFAPLASYRKCGYLIQLYKGNETGRMVLVNVNDVGIREDEGAVRRFIHNLRNLIKTLL